MPQQRIVITGIGLISPLGTEVETFWGNLARGESAIKEITCFDVADYHSHQGAEISNFDPKEYLGSKTRGLRYWDRVSLLVASAACRTLEDAQLPEDYPGEELGVVLGSTYGSIGSISAFDTTALQEGPNYVSPMEFPNTVLNGPAGRVSILVGAKGINSTLSTGETSGLDAICYAVDFLRMQRVRGVLAGGVGALTAQVYWGFYQTGYLAGSDGRQPELCAPFDARRNGIILGEGAVCFFLETLENARQRQAHIYGEILGTNTLFNPARSENPRDTSGGERLIRGVLQNAQLQPADISYIAAAANSSLSLDTMESRLITKCFPNGSRPPASAIKSMIGETLDAGGPFQLLAGLLALQHNCLPPTINYAQVDEECDLDCVPQQARQAQVKHVLVPSYAYTGHCSAVVLAGPPEN